MAGAIRRQPLLDDGFLGALETLELYLRSAVGSRFAGNRKSRAFGGVSEFADYREYQRGDDLRRIDWNLVGRTGQYFIKRFMDERKQDVHIYIDASASMLGEGDGSKPLCALRLAAAVGYLAVSAMDSVSFRLLSGHACRDLGGKINGRIALFRALETLSDVSFAGDCDLGAAVAADASPGYDDGLSLIISDFLTDSNWKRAVDRLRMRKREVTLARIISPGEEKPGYRGMQSLKDAENPSAEAVRLEVDREALKAYQEGLTWFSADMASFCASRGVGLLCLRSDESVQDALIKNGFGAGLIQ